MQVGAADAGGGYFDDGVVGVLDLGDGGFLDGDFEGAILPEEKVTVSLRLRDGMGYFFLAYVEEGFHLAVGHSGCCIWFGGDAAWIFLSSFLSILDSRSMPDSSFTMAIFQYSTIEG